MKADWLLLLGLTGPFIGLLLTFVLVAWVFSQVGGR